MYIDVAVLEWVKLETSHIAHRPQLIVYQSLPPETSISACDIWLGMLPQNFWGLKIYFQELKQRKKERTNPQAFKCPLESKAVSGKENVTDKQYTRFHHVCHVNRVKVIVGEKQQWQYYFLLPFKTETSNNTKTVPNEFLVCLSFYKDTTHIILVSFLNFQVGRCYYKGTKILYSRLKKTCGYLHLREEVFSIIEIVP